MKTLKEMVSIMNEAIKVLEGKKTSYSEMHNEIRDIIEDLDISEDMRYFSWNIQIDNEEMPCEYKSKVVNLELDGIEDKRSTLHAKVKINSLEFKITNPDVEGMTIDQVITYYKRVALEKYINNAEIRIQELYKELEKARLEKENMIRELINLK